jgi:hypothetical protein
LARLQHDLVKRLVWPARDALDAGDTPAAGSLTASLIDDEGRPVTAMELWKAMEPDAPPGLDTTGFRQALERALEAARAGDASGVMALQVSFDELAAMARSLEEKGKG